MPAPFSYSNLDELMKYRNVIKNKKGGWFCTSINIYFSSTYNQGSRLNVVVLGEPALSLFLVQLFLWGTVKVCLLLLKCHLQVELLASSAAFLIAF